MSESDRQANAARTEARRNRLAKWAWSITLIPPGVVGFFLLDFETFVRFTTLGTWVLSVVALSLANHSAQKGAEAKAAGYEHP